MTTPNEIPEKKEVIVTPREIELIQHLSTGMTTREAAAAMGIAKQTVVNMRHYLIKKLGYRNITQVVAECLREQLIS